MAPPQHGGSVPAGFERKLDSATAGGVIYFTTDGSDPRIPWTGAASGTLYSVPITLNTSVTVKARVRNVTDWSALNEAFFSVDTVPASAANLVVSVTPNPDGTQREFWRGTIPVPGDLRRYAPIRLSVPQGGRVSFDFMRLPWCRSFPANLPRCLPAEIASQPESAHKIVGNPYTSQFRRGRGDDSSTHFSKFFWGAKRSFSVWYV